MTLPSSQVDTSPVLDVPRWSVVLPADGPGGDAFLQLVSPMLPEALDGRGVEREEISRGLAGGETLRLIAARLHRAPSTISREIASNGGCSNYRATRADRAAVQRRRRPKKCKLASDARLRRLVTAKLKRKWSPEQIAGWVKHTYPGDAELQVSHETIYRTLYIQSRGALKREVTEHLRTRRKTRRPGQGNRGRGSGRDQLVGMVHISERPPEAEDRAIRATGKAI